MKRNTQRKLIAHKEIPIKAKTLSNVSKALAVLWLVIAPLGIMLGANRLPTDTEAKAIVMIALAIAGMYSAVDISILTKNIKARK